MTLFFRGVAHDHIEDALANLNSLGGRIACCVRTVHKVCTGPYPLEVGRHLQELRMPPLVLQEEGLTQGATIPPTARWNAPHKVAPACDLGARFNVF